VVRSRFFVFDRPITVDVVPATAEMAALVIADNAVTVWLATKKLRKSKKTNMRLVLNTILNDPTKSARVFLNIFTNEFLYDLILN